MDVVFVEIGSEMFDSMIFIGIIEIIHLEVE
jgi:hypothetical protein